MTKAQENTYNEILEKLNRCLSCKTFREYMEYQYNLKAERFASIKSLYPTLDSFIECGDEFKKIHEDEYKLAHEKNAVWGFFNTATLRCLEKQGYIKVLKYGNWNSDIIVVL